MHRDLEAVLLTLLRSRHFADRMGPLLHALLLARLVAGGAHAGPPHPAVRAPHHVRAKRHRLPHRDSLSGRRPRG